MTWDDLELLRSSTELPIVLKGIQHPDDARRAVDAGVDGIVVSNHGGRQVDGAIGSLDALPGVVDVVPDDFPVLFDSGIRNGSDAFKALALGARAVLLGRMYAWGLALGGEQGVRHVVRGLLAELDLTLALAGHTNFGDVGADAMTRLPE
jgi:isopentenyl diphosphate isomerase/L-lactate dehydrogenase-like FMN-dependent dehydrogenase